MTVARRLQTCYDEAEVCEPYLRETCAQNLRKRRSSDSAAEDRRRAALPVAMPMDNPRPMKE